MTSSIHSLSRRHFSRRQFVQALSAVSATALTANAATRQQIAKPIRHLQVTRKSAAQMTTVEIDRFMRAYDLIIKNGTLDRLIGAHADMSQMQHEFVANVTLNTFHLMPYPAGERFLPWHRAFLLEMETALRSALMNQGGADEASKVFIPYWDVSHMTGMPGWVVNWFPKGMTAVSVEGLPPNHPGFGVPGKRYAVQIQRYETKYRSAQSLPLSEQMNALLQLADFQSFTRRLEWAPTIVRTASANELTQLKQMGLRVNDRAQSYAGLADLLAGGRLTPTQQIDFMTLTTRLESIRMDANFVAGANQQAAQELLDQTMQFYQLGPHTQVHLWAAGHNALVKGTVLYTHENVADPLFWMLHCEIDRMWMTWQSRYSGKPNLQGADATFQPLNPGRLWLLPELLNTRGLSYRYDQFYVA